MRIVARKTLVAYAGRHPNTASSLAFWLRIAATARWRSMNDVTLSFRNCKVLNAERARFELGGGHRLIVSFSFVGPACWIKFIGTHKEYDAVDALTVSLF